MSAPANAAKPYSKAMLAEAEARQTDATRPAFVARCRADAADTLQLLESTLVRREKWPELPTEYDPEWLNAHLAALHACIERNRAQ